MPPPALPRRHSLSDSLRPPLESPVVPYRFAEPNESHPRNVAKGMVSDRLRAAIESASFDFHAIAIRAWMAAAHSLARSMTSGGERFFRGQVLETSFCWSASACSPQFPNRGPREIGLAGNWRRNAGPGKKGAWGHEVRVRAPPGCVRTWRSSFGCEIYFFGVGRIAGEASAGLAKSADFCGSAAASARRLPAGRKSRDERNVHNQRDAVKACSPDF